MKVHVKYNRPLYAATLRVMNVTLSRDGSCYSLRRGQPKLIVTAMPHVCVCASVDHDFTSASVAAYDCDKLTNYAISLATGKPSLLTSRNTKRYRHTTHQPEP